MLVGNYLTTNGAEVDDDKKMLDELELVMTS